ncbi:MAG TPA: asparagine synthetase, partial [Candidatus Acetothermia bacterium]|nr:asparagine synthetase [Candidatus Acetothermia bacterium]
MSSSATKQLVDVLKVKDEIMHAAREYLRDRGFTEILPVILSPITDPLHHDTFDGTVNFYGSPYQLTKSMILHKQIALRTLPRIYSVSPNVRMEPAERASFGRYLAEFVQLDLEVRDASRDEIISVGEGLLVHVLTAVTERCPAELVRLGRDLATPEVPFKRITFQEAQEQFGKGFDDALSASLSTPAWVIDFPRSVREFYDREDPARTDVLLDMDLMYPEGYGEALSGGEREHSLPRILRRLEQDGIDKERFSQYLSLVEEGIPASAGFGIGVERLTRFICGLENVEQARLFPK